MGTLLTPKREKQSCVILDGKFRVTTDGEVFRIRSGREEPATMYGTSRDRRYLVVSYTLDGKQKHEYVHRLVAKAFIANPNNYPQVNHLDGNPRNNKAENLEWCTQAQNAAHAYKIGLRGAHTWAKPCRYCGDITMRNDLICSDCRKDINSNAEAKRMKKAKQERLKKTLEQLKVINPSVLSEKELEIIEYRKKGFGFSEIGQICEVSRQAIDQTIARAIRKSMKYTGGA